MKLPLALALMLLALPGLAEDATVPADRVPAKSASVEKAHPDLLRLEKALTSKQEDRKEGRIKPEQYQEWEAKFRAFLDATIARAPQSPDNTAVHARIVAMLGERAQARATLDQALEQNPESPVLLRTKGQMLYEQKDYPGAAQHGLLAWEKSGRSDRAALSLYQMSKDRRAPSEVAPSPSPGSSQLAQAPLTVSADGTSKPYKLAVGGRAKPGEVPTLNSEAPQEPTPGHSPLLPILIVTGTGLTVLGGYKVFQSQSTSKSEDGINPAPYVSPEQARRNSVNAAVIIGTPIVVACLVYGGPPVWRAVAPAAAALWRGSAVSLQKIATSEAGAVFPEDQIAAQRVSLVRAASAPGSASNLPSRFFEGTRYAPRVLTDLEGGDYHAFPEIVRKYAGTGQVTALRGGDGIVRQMLKIPGSYQGRQGVFEFIKEPDGVISHRLFRPQ